MRVVQEVDPSARFVVTLGKRGESYLKAKLGSMMKAAQAGQSVLMLVDSDGQKEASQVENAWLSSLTFRSSDFFFGVAVEEAESWFLADGHAVAHLLNSQQTGVPSPADQISDPKEWLLNRTRRAPRALREQLVREESGKVSIGVGYNNLLSKAVAAHWEPGRARVNSPSLDYVMNRLAQWL